MLQIKFASEFVVLVAIIVMPCLVIKQRIRKAEARKIIAERHEN